MRNSLSNYIDGLRLSESDNGRIGATLDTPSIGGSAQEVRAMEQLGRVTPSGSVIDNDGYRTAPARFSEQYRQNYEWVERQVERAMRGDRWAQLRLQEAMTTSDFNGYFGDVLDRSVLANYAETPYSWDKYAKRAILNDLRQAKMFRVDRGAAVLDGPLVPNSFGATGSGATGLEQVAEYPLRRRVMSNYTDQLYKFGCRMNFSFEVFLNDDLDALKDTPALFGRAARRTEEKRATEKYVTSAGPNSAFFNTANLNVINNTVLPNYTGLPNPPFSLEALKWALVVMSNQRDLDGEPISIEAATLVYPPALKADVKNVLSADKAFFNIQGGDLATFGSGGTETATSAIRLFGGNWARDIVDDALNYYLPVVDTTYGNQAWYLFASPKMGRPALQLSFLRGREMPQIFMKLPNQVAIGEGRMGPGAGVMPGTMNVNPMEGDFETDSVDYKIRHFLGGTLLDPIMAVASNGSGT